MPDRSNKHHGVRHGFQPHILPEASNALFTSSKITFTEKKNTLKGEVRCPFEQELPTDTGQLIWRDRVLQETHIAPCAKLLTL
jgi:hypothetical protein